MIFDKHVAVAGGLVAARKERNMPKVQAATTALQEVLAPWSTDPADPSEQLSTHDFVQLGPELNSSILDLSELPPDTKEEYYQSLKQAWGTAEYERKRDAKKRKVDSAGLDGPTEGAPSGATMSSSELMLRGRLSAQSKALFVLTGGLDKLKRENDTLSKRNVYLTNKVNTQRTIIQNLGTPAQESEAQPQESQSQPPIQPPMMQQLVLPTGQQSPAQQPPIMQQPVMPPTGQAPAQQDLMRALVQQVLMQLHGGHQPGLVVLPSCMTWRPPTQPPQPPQPQ